MLGSFVRPIKFTGFQAYPVPHINDFLPISIIVLVESFILAYDKKTLERLYRERNIPWDLGKPYKQLVDYVNENSSCRALDVGCGTGTDAIFLAQNGFNVSAIDISEEAIKVAKSQARKIGVSIDFNVGNVLDMPFDDETFGFVNDNGCFHLLDESNWRGFVNEVARVTKHSGKYLMKCFSDKEPPNPKIPYRLSQETIRQYFSEKFDILYIRAVPIEGKHGNHEGYSVLMKRK